MYKTKQCKILIMTILTSWQVQLGASEWASSGRQRVQPTPDTLNIPSGETFPNKLISIGLGGLVEAEWFLSATLSRCPTVESDICFLAPSIGSNVSLCRFGVSAAGDVAGTFASRDLMRPLRPCLQRGCRTGGCVCVWGGGGLGVNIADIQGRSKGLWKADAGTFVGLGALKCLASAEVRVWI